MDAQNRDVIALSLFSMPLGREWERMRPGMGIIVQATCSCGYCSEDLFIGHGIGQGPSSALAVCRHCREMLSVREGRRQCPRCRKRLETLGIEDVDALVAGLECPRCGRPTLALESRVKAFKNKLVERLRVLHCRATWRTTSTLEGGSSCRSFTGLCRRHRLRASTPILGLTRSRAIRTARRGPASSKAHNCMVAQAAGRRPSAGGQRKATQSAASTW